MTLDSIEKLYYQQLKDLFSAESQLLEALPKMASAATNPDLRKAFSDHHVQTEEHQSRIQSLFSTSSFSPHGHHCMAIEGLIKEGEEMIKAKGLPEVIDAGLIAAAQRVEHYEISAYGSARALAGQMGLNEDVIVLTQTLEEEGDADKLLTELAFGGVNQTAAEV